MALKQSGYRFNSLPICSPITTPPRRFHRVIRAQGGCCHRRTFAAATVIGCFLLPLPSFTAAAASLTTQVEVEGTGENVLAKHAEFFDRNNDGVVYPWETYQGFRAIGSNILLSTVATFIINVGLSQSTRPGKFPSLLFPIEIKNIAKAKHGSDTGVYDTQGRFVPSKFEAIFDKHAHTNPNALTSKELDEMLKAMREPKDFVGWFGAFVEWKILFSLAKDKDGLLQRDTIRGAYDGSLFEKMENERLNYNK